MGKLRLVLALVATQLLIYGYGFSQTADEVHTTGYMHCDFEKLMSSDEAEKFHYHEGEVLKVEGRKVVVGIIENDRPYKLILKNNCPSFPCFKKGDYVKAFVNPESLKACVKHRED